MLVGRTVRPWTPSPPTSGSPPVRTSCTGVGVRSIPTSSRCRGGSVARRAVEGDAARDWGDRVVSTREVRRRWQAGGLNPHDTRKRKRNSVTLWIRAASRRTGLARRSMSISTGMPRGDADRVLPVRFLRNSRPDPTGALSARALACRGRDDLRGPRPPAHGRVAAPSRIRAAGHRQPGPRTTAH